MNQLMPEPAAVAGGGDLSARAGYDPSFLGPVVPIPTLPAVKTVLLPYVHFSVLMRPDKRLAAVTALGAC